MKMVNTNIFYQPFLTIGLFLKTLSLWNVWDIEKKRCKGCTEARYFAFLKFGLGPNNRGLVCVRSHAGQVRSEALENFIINIIQELFNEKPLSIFITHCLVKGLLLFRAHPLPRFMVPVTTWPGSCHVTRYHLIFTVLLRSRSADVKIGQLLIPGI